MKIDYNWGKPPKKRRNWRLPFRSKPVPMHMSNHYVREHFHPEDDPQGKLF